MTSRRPSQLRAGFGASDLGGCNFVCEQFLEGFEYFLATTILKEGVGSPPSANVQGNCPWLHWKIMSISYIGYVGYVGYIGYVGYVGYGGYIGYIGYIGYVGYIVMKEM